MELVANEASEKEVLKQEVELSVNETKREVPAIDYTP